MCPGGKDTEPYLCLWHFNNQLLLLTVSSVEQFIYFIGQIKIQRGNSFCGMIG